MNDECGLGCPTETQQQGLILLRYALRLSSQLWSCLRL